MAFNETDFINIWVLSNDGHIRDDNLVVLTSEPIIEEFRKNTSEMPQCYCS